VLELQKVQNIEDVQSMSSENPLEINYLASPVPKQTDSNVMFVVTPRGDVVTPRGDDTLAVPQNTVDVDTNSEELYGMFVYVFFLVFLCRLVRTNC